MDRAALHDGGALVLDKWTKASGVCAMEYTASDCIEMRDIVLREIDLRDLEQWSEGTTVDDKTRQHKNRGKKRRRPLRKNRKPARPDNYIGQRNNNRLLKICAKG